MTSKKLIALFRDLFIAYGAPTEISSDGGSQFISDIFKKFLSDWDIHHRLSSVSYPQSNGRAEIAVRAGKRIIYDNVSSDGSLNNDKAARAILQYRSTPLPDINLSPAQILLHRNIRDGLPAHPDHYIPHKEWVITAEERDLAYARRNEIIKQKYDKRARKLPVLSIGDSVVVQNQRTGKKWDRLGRIVEVLPHRQYRIRMVPSGRITLINRRFIRPYTIAKPAQMRPTGPINKRYQHQHQLLHQHLHQHQLLQQHRLYQQHCAS